MPCQAQIQYVNGLVPPGGGTTPTVLRVIGRMAGCPGNGQVQVVSNLSAVPVIVPVSATDRFAADILIPGTTSISCGDPVTVTATCTTDLTCTDSYTGPLNCCEPINITAFGVVPVGGLLPTDIRISGIMHGCYGGQVDVQTSVTGAGATTVSLDPLTDQFNVLLHLTTPIACDDPIDVTVTCTQNPACRYRNRRSSCPAKVRYVREDGSVQKLSQYFISSGYFPSGRITGAIDFSKNTYHLQLLNTLSR